MNVYSRVQMMLFKARLAAKEEYKKALETHGISVEDLRNYLAKKSWRGAALFYPAHGSYASMAASMVEHVADDLKKTRVARIFDFAKATAKRALNRSEATSQHAAAAAH